MCENGCVLPAEGVIVKTVELSARLRIVKIEFIVVVSIIAILRLLPIAHLFRLAPQ